MLVGEKLWFSKKKKPILSVRVFNIWLSWVVWNVVEFFLGIRQFTCLFKISGIMNQLTHEEKKADNKNFVSINCTAYMSLKSCTDICLAVSVWITGRFASLRRSRADGLADFLSTSGGSGNATPFWSKIK